MTDLSNIYEDGHEPEVGLYSETYIIRVPEHKYTHWARLEIEIENDGYANLESWRWGDFRSVRGPGAGYRFPEDRERYDAMQEVYEWLREWDIIELRRIGPDDSEYFATDEFLEAARKEKVR